MSVRPRRFAAVTFALAAAVVIWLSHPSVFVLGAVSFALVFRELVNRNWANALAAVVASLPWLASFGIFVLTASNNLVLLQTALRGSPGAFAGAGGSGLEPLRRGLGEFRYVTGVPHFLRHGNVDAGLVVLALVAALCIVGTVALASRSYEKALLLVLPLALMLIGWGVGKYPLLGRTQLFLLPSFSLLLAEGIVRIVQRPRRAPLQLASAALAAGVVIAVAAPAAGHLLRPATLEDVRPVLDYVAHSQRRTDTIYVYYAAEYQLRYYLECGCAGRAFKEAVKSGLWPLRPALGGPAPFAPALRSRQPRFQVSVFRGEDAAEYVADIAALRGRGRVWFLLSAVDATNRALLLRTFDRYGVRQSAFSVGEGENVAAAYLYNMRPVRKTRAP
jgi:hypothetical protein